jgi:hypothetical protein
MKIVLRKNTVPGVVWLPRGNQRVQLAHGFKMILTFFLMEFIETTRISKELLLFNHLIINNKFI